VLAPLGYAWVAPALIVAIGVLYYSIFYTGYLSTLDWDGSSPMKRTVGLENYQAMLGDPVFWGAVRHTVVYFVATFCVQTLLGMVLAAIMHSQIRLAMLYKIMIFIPVVLAPAFMAPVFRQILAADGSLNRLLQHIGLGALKHAWLAESGTALPTIIMVSVWGSTGICFVLYYAALGQIDPEMIEAARIDGAGAIRIFRSMIVPSVKGTTLALAILTAIGALKTFDWPYLVTNAGPNHATEFLGTYIYRSSIPLGHVGYGAALSIVLLLMAVVVALVLNRARDKEPKSV
jgi:ABC-type sugar transport system permease subunit